MPAFLLWIGVVLSIGVSLFGFRLRYPSRSSQRPPP